MPYTPEIIDELKMLCYYNLANIDEGLKAHHTADPTMVAAMRRLHDKGLVTHEDGGYLTDLGREAAEHAQAALTILTSERALAQ